ncbi:MAG: flagellar type III secretion system pore protein FliP [Pseudobdellovibrionaceae bacterium]|nr:flagellar type III secretion system pore protein FliP [Pseudobdellovibrionaceae bacterium]
MALLIGSSQVYAETKIPGLNFNIYEVDDPDALVPALKIIALLTILGVAPAILLMMTSFTRIVVVLSFVRQALGTQTMPPNQVILGLSLFLTFFTMGPVIDVIQERALTPYLEKAITQEQAVNELMAPLRTFMLREVKESDLQAFFNIAKLPKPKSMDDVPMRVLIPSFVVSELKTAFQIGFLIYIPFLVIDMVVSSVLMGMGMMMLPPTVVSLPFKLVLFVLVDGWGLIVDSLVRSFSLS